MPIIPISAVRRLFRVLPLTLLLLSSGLVAQEAAQEPAANETPVSESRSDRFSQQKTGLFVVQTVEKVSNRKVGVGTGFRISDDGLIASNYHVVSDHILRPEKFKLRYQNSEKDEGDLSVVAVDVVNDLAILQLAQSSEQSAPEDWVFELAGQVPRQGDEITAMGNPYDIGLSLVPGIYNGVTDKGFRSHIHFTGALNPGMSGGPAVNELGQVVGINVAGAGNSVSFLVPVEALAALSDRAAEQDRSPEAVKQRILADLTDYQQNLIDDLVAGDWSLSEFGPLQIPTDVRDYVNCTADTTRRDPDLRYDYHTSNCGVHDRVYLSSTFSTGTVEFDYAWYRSDQLNQLQFYKLFENVEFSPMNQAGKDDVSRFKCAEDIASLDALDDAALKMVTCTRAYLDYQGLYDVLFYAKSLLDSTEGVYLHYTLAGVTRESARRFNQQFIEAVQWK